MNAGKTNETENKLIAGGTPQILITTKPGQVMLGTLDVWVKNQGDDIAIGEVYIVLPCGEAGTDLVVENTAGGIKPEPGIPSSWKMTNMHDLTPGLIKAEPTPDGTFLLKKDHSVGFTMNEITLSHDQGQSEFQIQVFKPNSEDVLFEQVLIIKKVLSIDTWITLIADPEKVIPGGLTKLMIRISGIDKYTVTESTSTAKLGPFTKDEDIDRNPRKTTKYTVRGTAPNVLMQAQVEVTVTFPELNEFLVLGPVDKGGNAMLTWKTTYAEKVFLTSHDPDIQFNKNGYDPNTPAEGIAIGPINRNLHITAEAIGNGEKSGDKEKSVTLNPPRVKSFNITALPIEPNKACRFRLDWDIINQASYTIKAYHGQDLVEILHLGPNDRTTDVSPRYAETKYKLEVFGPTHVNEEK